MAVVVIGNGKSRQHLDLNKIKEKAWTFGCNALYRDFAPDYLLTVDGHITHEVLDSDYALNNKVLISNMNPLPGEVRDSMEIPADAIVFENEPTGYEFIYNGFRRHHHITWIKEKCQISHVPSPIYGGSAGIQLIRVAHEYYPKDIKYLIGFDVFGERDNMYDGTNAYPSEGAANTMTDEFIEGFKDLLNIYDDLIMKRVIDQNQSLENIPNVSEDELWQKLQDNQKI
jgi:hypothetical protein